MKKTTKFSFFIFLIILFGGLVALFIPFDYKKFNYSINKSQILIGEPKHSLVLNFKINNNTNDVFEDLEIKISFATKKTEGIQTVVLSSITLNKGENTFEEIVLKTFFPAQTEELAFVQKIEIKYKDDSNFFQIYLKGALSDAGWYILSFILIGTIGLISSSFIWLSNSRFDSERQKKFFKNDLSHNAHQTVLTKQHSKKIVCKYCGSKVNSNFDKCPNCGAPIK